MAMAKMKIAKMQIIKIILGIVYFGLISYAVHLLNNPNLSPLPLLIGVSMLVVMEIVISHILIKTNHTDSPFFDPEHKWKYGFPVSIAVLLIVIMIYLYQLSDLN